MNLALFCQDLSINLLVNHFDKPFDKVEDWKYTKARWIGVH